MDAEMRRSTTIALLILGAVCVWLVAQATHREIPVGVRVGLAGGAIGIAGGIAFAWLSAPRALRLEGMQVVVERRSGPIRFATSKAEALGADRLHGSVRTFGVAGLFGSFGSYRNATLGSYRKFATRSSGYVLLTTERGPVVVTPADPDAFLLAWGAARR
jgi:hypothetical protein